MSKTIKIPYLSEYSPDWQRTLTLDVCDFASRVREPDPSMTPVAWLYAGLIMHDNSTTKFKLTPRGEDLLASIDSIPDDPQPEVKAKPCSKCNGSGEQPLFVSMETCSRCEGSKVEPRASGINALVEGFTGVLKPTYEIQVTSGRTSSRHPNTDTLPRLGYSAFIYPTASGDVVERSSEPEVSGHPWVLINSEEVAQQFVGKRVQIDAPFVPGYGQHSLHGCVRTPGHVNDHSLSFGQHAGLNWRARGNVRLRLVDGDPS